MMLIISQSELAAAQALHEQAQAAKAAPPPATTGFVYQPRSAEQWERRINQDFTNNRHFHPKWPKADKRKKL